MHTLEPTAEKAICAYCGDAPINHRLFYVMSLLSTNLDNHTLKVTKHAPDFLRVFVDWLLATFFNILLFLNLARLSDDIDLASTWRSRVVWEEARHRGIEMQQVIMFGRPADQYRAKINGKYIYFNSLPIPPELLAMTANWDDKFILKNELGKFKIPVPHYIQFSIFSSNTKLEQIFSKLQKPIIVKPRSGSRGRHTITNIQTLQQFKDAVSVAEQISSFLVAEEHLEGDVCRATFVSGKLMGFYRGSVPMVVGDGSKTISALIKEKDEKRHARVERVHMSKELEQQIARAGFTLASILPAGVRLPLSHRTGRFFGGATKEILDELHPSFISILTEAAKLVGLPVVGFDVIAPDPTADAGGQRWGIIECNTLPYIDLHYYALEGKPKNIAGAIWDLWK